MMKPEQVTKALERRCQQHNECTAEDALSESVDTERFYRFIASVASISVSDREVEVTFNEPAPGETTLAENYTYQISVGEDDVESHSRCGMPREDLLALHQLSITIWAMVTGEIY